MLNFFNEKFINCSIKTKIELYLLPLIFLYLLFYINTELLKTSSGETKPQLFEQNMEFKGNFLDLFFEIENYASKNEITIISLTNKEKIVFIKAKANLMNIESFIEKLENMNNFSNIKSLNIHKELFEIQLDLNNFYIKKTKEKLIFPTQKNQENQIVEKTKQIKDYKLNAIVLNYVFINDIWIKKDENIDDLKLVKIGKNFVELQNKENIIKLELINDANIKNFN